MFASVSNASTPDSDNLSAIPEWKKILIMKKRAGCSPASEEHGRRNLDSNVNIVRNGVSSVENYGVAGGCSNKFCVGKSKVAEPEVSPPKTVTIGNINVELRSVNLTAEVVDKNSICDLADREPENGEDLRYGPGIVDRLRARFLNIGVQKKQPPVVRRFSSLENLPGSHGGPYRVNARGVRQNGVKSCLSYGPGYVKKAQSMETLTCSAPEQQIFTSSRRPNARIVIGGVKARIMSRNITPISVFSDETDKPKDKSPSPSVSPRLFCKTARRWDYGRSVSAPNINEDELPKPDTVKHVKKIFESPPPPGSTSEKNSGIPRFRKIPSTTTPVSTTLSSTCNNGAIIGSVTWPAVKKTLEEDAKPCAKDLDRVNNGGVPTPDSDEERYDFFEIADTSVEDNQLSANGSCEERAEEPPVSPRATDLLGENDCGGELYSSDLESPNKVTPEQLPLEQCHKHSELLSQGNQLEVSSSAELSPEGDPPTAGVHTTDNTMVVSAASGGDSFSSKKGAPSWQKPPQQSTSIVFDFRGRKDVEPHISLNPAPFGCRPAKVSKNSGPKKSTSPPGSPVNGIDSGCKVEDDHRNNEDDDYWDEMDIGADLPAISGIVFAGENVKVGRGSFLEKRNKKLNIQFDDKATSTFEYPSENLSPSPQEEGWSDSFDSTTAMGSASNCRLGLSYYTPQVLSSRNLDFELGISHRSLDKPPEKSEEKEDVPLMDVIIPADPDESAGWSATETADILF